MRGRAETVLTALKSDSSSLAFASDELLSDGAFIKGSCNPNLNLSAKPNLNLSPHPNLNLSPNPNLNLSAKPNLNLSPHPNLNLSPHPNLNLSAKPNLNLSPNLSDGAFIKGSCNVSFRLLV
jgi:hypothetical protein